MSTSPSARARAQCLWRAATPRSTSSPILALAAALLPSLSLRHQRAEQSQSRCFSSTPPQWQQRGSRFRRKPGLNTPRNNLMRGMSPLRRSGLPSWHRVHTRGQPLPIPRLTTDDDFPDLHRTIKTSPNHGLWGFFNIHKRILAYPKEDDAYTRAWTFDELSCKSWEDLHRLWWVCVKDINRLATEAMQRERLEPGYGKKEADARVRVIRWTQRGIKTVLKQRWYAFEDAVKLSKVDPRINWTHPEGEIFKKTPMRKN